MDMKRDLEFTYEIGALRFIRRAWSHLVRDRDVANLAEHTFRVAWLAMLIAKKEGVEDLGKVAKMALVHDICESRTGDVEYVQRLYVKRDEDTAIVDMFAGTDFGEEFVALWREAEAKESIEAKCVKDADWLDVDLEMKEMEFTGNKIAEKDGWGRDQVRDRLYTETGKRIWEEIVRSDPNDWHKNAKNRLNTGDWKNKTSA